MTRSHVPILRPERKKKPVSRLQRGGRIKPVSATKAKLQKIYSALRKAYLAEHPICEWWLKENGWKRAEGIEIRFHPPHGLGSWNIACLVAVGAPPSEEVHHRKGRGKYYLDTSTWMAVSSAGHRWIHDNPKLAYERQYMLPRN